MAGGTRSFTMDWDENVHETKERENREMTERDGKSTVADMMFVWVGKEYKSRRVSEEMKAEAGR